MNKLTGKIRRPVHREMSILRMMVAYFFMLQRSMQGHQVPRPLAYTVPQLLVHSVAWNSTSRSHCPSLQLLLLDQVHVWLLPVPSVQSVTLIPAPSQLQLALSPSPLYIHCHFLPVFPTDFRLQHQKRTLFKQLISCMLSNSC